MASIGSFGTVPEPTTDVDPDTFSFYGEEFTVPDAVPWVYIGEFSEAADSDGAEAFSAGMRMIRGIIGAAQWPKFRDLAALHCSSFEDLMGPCMAIVEVVSARPTQRPSDSADGSQPTAAPLRELSSSEESSVPPILKDPRIRELRSVEEAGAELLSGEAV